MKKMGFFPPELVDEFLILLSQSDDCIKILSHFDYFILKIGRYQEESKYICSGRVLDAIAKRISSLYKEGFIVLRPNFEKILMKSESLLGTAEETPSLCSLLESLTQDELSIPLARCLLSHCGQSNDMVTLFLERKGKESTLDPVLFELVLLLPIEKRTMPIQTLKTHPEFVSKFVDGLTSIPGDRDIKEFFNSFFASPDENPTFLKQTGSQIVGLSNEKVVSSFLAHLIEEESWLKPEYFNDLTSLISNAAESHSLKTYLLLISTLMGPSFIMKVSEPYSCLSLLLESLESFYSKHLSEDPSYLLQPFAMLMEKLSLHSEHPDEDSSDLLQSLVMLMKKLSMSD